MYAYCLNNPVSRVDGVGEASYICIPTRELEVSIFDRSSEGGGGGGGLEVIAFGLCIDLSVWERILAILTGGVSIPVIRIVQSSSKSGKQKTVSVPASVSGGSPSVEPPDPKNWKKLDEKFLEKKLEEKGTDPHRIKKKVLGSKVKLSHYDIYRNTRTKQLGIGLHNTKKLLFPIDFFLED